MADRLIDRIWWSRDPGSALIRTALSPLGMLYLTAAELRNRAFETGRFRTRKSPVPVVSVGNLTAGGTGKTPVSAFLANELRRRGAKPGIVMRGYGNDEQLVHAVLAPRTPVIVASSRVAGAARAQSEHGCDVVILDDGFQHRWIDRDVDIVLLGAEETLRPRFGLPAGPWRERLDAIGRATMAVVTRKSASATEADQVVAMVERAARGVPVATVQLAADALVTENASREATRVPLDVLSGQSILVIAAIANAQAFVDQMRGQAGQVTAAVYPDHHAFSSEETAGLASRARLVDRVVCTLKDYVKLAPFWPGDGPPLWYVSQQVIIERGADVIDRQLDILLRARHN